MSSEVNGGRHPSLSTETQSEPIDVLEAERLRETCSALRTQVAKAVVGCKLNPVETKSHGSLVGRIHGS